MTYRIIDCDNMVIIGYFDDEHRDEGLEEYENAIEWDCVSFDLDGDLCLFRPEDEQD